MVMEPRRVLTALGKMEDDTGHVAKRATCLTLQEEHHKRLWTVRFSVLAVLVLESLRIEG